MPRAVRETRNGNRSKISFWVSEELANLFDAATEARQVDISDVMRTAMLDFVTRHKQETESDDSAMLLARKVFRTILSTMSPAIVLEEVLTLLTSKEVDAILERHRSRDV